jgi:hypothetical protein
MTALGEDKNSNAVGRRDKIIQADVRIRNGISTDADRIMFDILRLYCKGPHVPHYIPVVCIAVRREAYVTLMFAVFPRVTLAEYLPAAIWWCEESVDTYKSVTQKWDQYLACIGKAVMPMEDAYTILCFIDLRSKPTLESVPLVQKMVRDIPKHDLWSLGEVTRNLLNAGDTFKYVGGGDSTLEHVTKSISHVCVKPGQQVTQTMIRNVMLFLQDNPKRLNEIHYLVRRIVLPRVTRPRIACSADGLKKPLLKTDDELGMDFFPNDIGIMPWEMQINADTLAIAFDEDQEDSQVIVRALKTWPPYTTIREQ